MVIYVSYAHFYVRNLIFQIFFIQNDESDRKR